MFIRPRNYLDPLGLHVVGWMVVGDHTHTPHFQGWIGLAQFSDIYTLFSSGRGSWPHQVSLTRALLLSVHALWFCYEHWEVLVVKIIVVAVAVAEVLAVVVAVVMLVTDNTTTLCPLQIVHTELWNICTCKDEIPTILDLLAHHTHPKTSTPRGGGLGGGTHTWSTYIYRPSLRSSLCISLWAATPANAPQAQGKYNGNP